MNQTRWKSELRCAACGNSGIVAIKIGLDPLRDAATGIILDHGTPDLAWCAECWPVALTMGKAR